ncbi:MAG: Asp23/Gls24 family envelope stress response protein [Anaerolineales bacterium]|nr:Asp23/Gls24 family envelope stress response protein [Anaerolineales bacterium]
MKEQVLETTNPDEYKEARGKTTIAPEVLLTIAQLTTLKTPGVSRMSNVPGGVNRLFRREYGEGVRIDIRDDVVYIDLHIILKKDMNIRDVSRQVQRNVARAISEMVGMPVGRVNIHVEDIDYSTEAETGSAEED